MMSIYNLFPFFISALKALDNFRITGIRGSQLVEKMRPVLNQYLHMPKWYVHELIGKQKPPAVNEHNICIQIPIMVHYRGVKPEEMEDAIRRDVVSHFALRLAYCKP